jgi:hypothetical protein
MGMRSGGRLCPVAAGVFRFKLERHLGLLRAKKRCKPG